MITEHVPDGYFSKTIFQKNLEGSWSVVGNVIQINGFGTGIPVQIVESGRPVNGFTFQISQVLNDPRAMNKPMILTGVTSNTGPKGKSINQFCGVHP